MIRELAMIFESIKESVRILMSDDESDSYLHGEIEG